MKDIFKTTLTKSTTFVSNIYKSISIIQPGYWFSTREATSIWKLYLYWSVVGFLVLLSVIFFFVWGRTKNDPLRKKFFARLSWFGLLFVLISLMLILFRAIGTPLLSARVVWLVLFLGLVYMSYISLINLARKIPQKQQARRNDLVKKKYLKSFRRR